MKNEGWYARLVIERDDLIVKIDKLNVYLESNPNPLMVIQAHIMVAYVRIVDLRLKEADNG